MEKVYIPCRNLICVGAFIHEGNVFASCHPVTALPCSVRYTFSHRLSRGAIGLKAREGKRRLISSIEFQDQSLVRSIWHQTQLGGTFQVVSYDGYIIASRTHNRLYLKQNYAPPSGSKSPRTPHISTKPASNTAEPRLATPGLPAPTSRWRGWGN